MIPLKPTLTFNCPEQWDKMKVGLVSRYCENCRRDVQDFTKMSREEILLFLLNNRGNKVCGRIRRTQLDYHHREVLITIDRYLKTSKSSNLSFYLLSMSALLMMGCVDDMAQKANLKPATEFASEADVNAKIDVNNLPEDIEFPGDSLFGDFIDVGIISIDTIDMPQTDVYTVVEVMPEFPGGMPALVAYITENMKYPKGESATTAFVEFIVDVDGDLRDIKILKSSDSEAFDKEVIRLIENMPQWKAGEHEGRKVKVRFVLPVRVRVD